MKNARNDEKNDLFARENLDHFPQQNLINDLCVKFLKPNK